MLVNVDEISRIENTSISDLDSSQNVLNNVSDEISAEVLRAYTKGSEILEYLDALQKNGTKSGRGHTWNRALKAI